MSSLSISDAEAAASPTFNDPSAEITFKSSDKVVFRIFRSHLKCNSAGFSPPENSDVEEIVQLSEPSEVLEILFGFIQPPSESRQYRQPSITNLEAPVFFAVAEAAEKYIVYSAMNACITRMSYLYANDPLETLNHCARHGYPDIANKAAEGAIGRSLREASVKLTHAGVLACYIEYYVQYVKICQDTLSKMENSPYRNCKSFMSRKSKYAQNVLNYPGLVFIIPPNDEGHLCECHSVNKRYCLPELTNIATQLQASKAALVTYSMIEAKRMAI